MDLFTNLSVGLATALTLNNLLFCFIGVALAPSSGYCRASTCGHDRHAPPDHLRPLARLRPDYDRRDLLWSAVRGFHDAILINLPGEASSVVTCLDGYQLARKGKAGVALATAAIGLLSPVRWPPLCWLFSRLPCGSGPEIRPGGIRVAGDPRARCLHRARHGSLLRATGMILLGLILGLVGTDISSAYLRYTFDIYDLADGIVL